MIRTTMLVLALAATPGLAEAGNGAGTVPLYSPTGQPEQTALYGPPCPVDGYRGARFGMDATQVRDAAAVDFAVPPGALQVAHEAGSGRAMLTLPVSLLEPADHNGTVAYVFGANGALERVVLTWTVPADERAGLISGARAAAQKFLDCSWQLFTTVRGVPRDADLVVFSGADEADHGVEVRLTGVPYDTLSGGLIQGVSVPAGPGTLRVTYDAYRDNNAAKRFVDGLPGR